eukprot:SAG11_NODE_1567_length_4672_cov_13.208834_7_plen_196_part_00
MCGCCSAFQTNFVCNHDYTRDRFADLSELTLKKWGDTRMACVFLALDRMVEVQPALRHMVDEEDYDDFVKTLSGSAEVERGLAGDDDTDRVPISPRARGERIKQLIMSGQIFERMKALTSMLVAPMMALRIFDAGRPDMGEVYRVMAVVNKELLTFRGDLAKTVQRYWWYRWTGGGIDMGLGRGCTDQCTRLPTC